MASFAFSVNETTENIGARRLHTIMERVLDEISFQAPDLLKNLKPAVNGVIAQVEPSTVEQPKGAAPLATATAHPLPVLERQVEGGVERVVVIDPEYVRQQVANIVRNQDLSRYIL